MSMVGIAGPGLDILIGNLLE